MATPAGESGDVPERPRGGFKRAELRTVPQNTISVKVEEPTSKGYRQVRVVANYVPVTAMPNRVIQMYRVDFEPEVESESRMRFLFRTASKGLFGTRPIYDGVHECRSGQKLTNQVTTVRITDPQDGNEYEVKFTNTGTSTFGAESIRVYNMHMKDFLRDMGFYSPQVGLFVHPDHSCPVGQDIMMLRGYRTAAHMHDCRGILMNFEAAHKLVQRRNVLAYMTEIQQRGYTGPLEEVLRTHLVGKVVVTSYNKRCYRIEDIDFVTKLTSTFDRNGTPTTFVDFYQNVHNKTLRVLDQPLLKVVPNNQRNRVETTRVTLLVPELCNLAGLTEHQRRDGRLKMDLIRASQIAPGDRVKHMKEFLAALHGNTKVKERLDDWGYSYGRDPINLTAHVVGATPFAFGRSCSAVPQEWPTADLNTANINVNGLAVTPQLLKMAIIMPKTVAAQKGRILQNLKEGFDRIGLTGPSFSPQMIYQDNEAQNSYVRSIRQLTPDTTVAIVIMERPKKDLYDAIKKTASVEKGQITQVVTGNLLTDEKKARSAALKIAIQVAAKIGGEPWWVHLPLKDTMICGYDTYHDTTKRGRSFGAFVASLNMRFSRWWSKADAHERLEEVSSQMSVNVMEAIKVYKKFNDNKHPEKVVIYRDGVGEGQLEHVFRVELEQVREALSSLTPKVRLTMIVVSKRIGARFYMQSGPNSAFSNPPPGTVVDHTVTREERFDFYLISQSTRQGTVTPTYYNIIHDEVGFPPEIHQRVAFRLCLLYYNWSGTVRVPAPCQYAHKLALLCGEHLHSQPHAQMDDKLHYL